MFPIDQMMKMTDLLDNLSLSSWQYLELKYSIQNRKQFFTALHHIFPPETRNLPELEEIYSYFLQAEIQDILGPTIYLHIEKDLESLPDITEFVSALVFSRSESKHKVLSVILGTLSDCPYISEPDSSLPKQISMLLYQDFLSGNIQERSKQLVIALMQKQLDDMLCGIDISLLLDQQLQIRCPLPETLKWNRLELNICCGCTKERYISSEYPYLNAEKKYIFRYPNVFVLTDEGIDRLETLLRGDLVLSGLAFRLFPKTKNPKSIFPAYDDILIMASKQYIHKLGSVDDLRTVLSLVPEVSFDRISIHCLRQNLLAAYRPIMPKSKIDIDQNDPEGLLTILAFSMDDMGNISRKNFDMMMEQRIRVVQKRTK